MDAKLKAVISHLFGVGWVIAVIFNSSNKEEYASYYIRQNLGIILVSFILSFVNVIPVLGQIVWVIGGIILFVFWLLSLVWSIQGEMKPIPWLGTMFQDWFRGL